MTNAPGTRGREPFEDTGGHAEAEPFFPSEGTFSTVVPLSQVRDGLVSARDSAANAAAPKETEEEATLVPTRVRRAPAAGRDGKTKQSGGHWLATATAVLLSLTAGVAAGAYMVWTRQAQQARPPVTQAADATAASQPAPTEPTQVAAPDAAGAAAPSAEVVKVERSESVETPSEVVKPEPASRRTSEAETRAARHARANAETAEAAPAPKPRRDEAAPRRQATPARPKPNATAASGRALPVSSPPPSAKSRTVIQWP